MKTWRERIADAEERNHCSWIRRWWNRSMWRSFPFTGDDADRASRLETCVAGEQIKHLGLELSPDVFRLYHTGTFILQAIRRGDLQAVARLTSQIEDEALRIKREQGV
jgi:hypothetical protein